MSGYLALPLVFVKFWFIDGPINIIQYFASLNKAFLQLFSLSLLVKTFFQPLKNEYREGLVGFSLVMGIVVKAALILVDLGLLILLLAVELAILFLFIVFPVLTIAMLFTPVL